MRNIIIGNQNSVSVSDKRAFKHYTLNAKHRVKENTYTSRKYSKVITAMYKKVARDLVDKEGGVFLKNLGYFTILKHPKKQVVKVQYQNNKEFFNTKTSNYLYTPSFFGFGKGRSLFKFWCMDRAFSRRIVKKPLHKKLMEGKKYKTYIATLFGLYQTNKD